MRYQDILMITFRFHFSFWFDFYSFVSSLYLKFNRKPFSQNRLKLLDLFLEELPSLAPIIID